MEIGELVYCISAVPNAPTLLAFGCESGKVTVNDIETNKSIYCSEQCSNSIIVIRPINNHTIFAATENEIICHDIRDGKNSKSIFKTPSELSDFVVDGDLIVIATYVNDIVLSDKRVLRKTQHDNKRTTNVLPSVCSSLCIQERDRKNLVAGYLDSTVGHWNLNTCIFTPYSTPNAAATSLNCSSVVHCVASKEDFVAVARQTGLYLYTKEGKLIIDHQFHHENGAVQSVAFAECFDTPHTISGAADGSLMVFDCQKLHPAPKKIQILDKVQNLTSNSRIMAVADTSENGNIGIFRPEDFFLQNNEKKKT